MNNQIVAQKLEESADQLERTAANLRANAKAVRKGRDHHANEAVSTICGLISYCNLNAIIYAITEKENE